MGTLDQSVIDFAHYQIMTNILPLITLLPILIKSIPIIDDLWVSSGDDCPELCTCSPFDSNSDGISVNCENVGLTTLPELPEDVVSLNLNNNDLRWLDESITDFSIYPDLMEITIADNVKLSGVSEMLFAKNLKLKSVNLQNHGIKNFGGVYVPNLSYLNIESDSLVNFDMDSFVEMNSIGNSMNPVSLIFGGYSLMNVKVDSVFSMLNEMDIQINGVSDSGTFDITKILIKFPNTRS